MKNGSLKSGGISYLLASSSLARSARSPAEGGTVGVSWTASSEAVEGNEEGCCPGLLAPSSWSAKEVAAELGDSAWRPEEWATMAGPELIGDNGWRRRHHRPQPPSRNCPNTGRKRPGLLRPSDTTMHLQHPRSVTNKKKKRFNDLLEN